MEMKRPLDEVRSFCQKKTIPELENILKTIEKEIVEVQNYLQKFEEGAKEAMMYPTVEAARNGLITFWSKREESQKRIKDLNDSINSLAKQMADANLSDNVKKEPKSDMSENMRNRKESIMDECYKLGETYMKHKGSLEFLKDMEIYLKGIIAEKRLEANPNSNTILLNYLQATHNEVKKPSESPKKPDEDKNQEQEFKGLKKGFFK